MKRTIDIQLGSVLFTIEDDANALLNNYLEDVESRLIIPCEAKDVIGDIEMRIADIFCEKINGETHVITTAMVRDAIDRIGGPSNFGGRRYTSPHNYQTERKQLFRSRTNRIFGGVCGGLANFFNVEVSAIRLLMFILVIFGGLSVFVYIVLWIVLPKEPYRFNNYSRNSNNRR